MNMFVRFCAQCDLIAIQEALEDTSSVVHLVEQLNNTPGVSYNYIISDATGQKPGETSLAERFCFVYNTQVVQFGKIASDITFDRTAVLNNRVSPQFHRDDGT